MVSKPKPKKCTTYLLKYLNFNKYYLKYLNFTEYYLFNCYNFICLRLIFSGFCIL